MSIPQRNSSLVLAVVAVLALPFLVSFATAHGDPLEVVELADLADGETRTFGEGEHAVTATRHGDRVVVNLHGADGQTVTVDRTLDCDLANDDCVVKFGDLGEQGNVFVFEMGSGGEDHRQIERRVEVVTSGAHGEAHGVVVGAHPRVQVMRIGEDGDIDADVDVHEIMQNLTIELGDLGAHIGDIDMSVPLMIVAGDGERAVRCPEGDTTMTVAEDELDGIYTCPKHGLKLETVESPFGDHFQWQIKTDDDDEQVEL